MAGTPPVLPTFVELMQSLGLDGSSRFSPRSRPRSLSSATSSSSNADDESIQPSVSHARGKYLLVPSHNERIHYGKELEADNGVSLRRKGRGRYSPYIPPATIPRKASMPALAVVDEFDRPPRAASTSPSTSPLDTSFPHRSLSIRATHPSRSERSLRRGRRQWATESDLSATMPISSFVRRKSPRSPSPSPTAFVFPADVSNPSVPLAIPALPTLIPQFLLASPSSTSATSLSDSSDDSMDLDASTHRPSDTSVPTNS